MTPTQQQLLGFKCYDDSSHNAVRLWTLDYEDIPTALGWEEAVGGEDGAGGAPLAPFLPTAKQQPNAFAVTLFCVEGALACRSGDFLPHAFARYPDRDYCVVTVPTTVLQEPALVRGLFTAAAPRPGTAYSHTLFVVHRDALLAPAHLKVT